MKSYNARLHSEVSEIDKSSIVLKTLAPVHKSVRLSWVEEIDEFADKREREWYSMVLKHVVGDIHGDNDR